MVFLKFIIGIVLTLFCAFVLMYLWSWFVSPFFQIRELNYGYALGFTLIGSLLTLDTSEIVAQFDVEIDGNYSLVTGLKFLAIFIIFIVGYLIKINL